VTADINSSDQSQAQTRVADACVMVIFGATGDLTKRKLIPALCNLANDGLLAEHFSIVGFAFDDLTTEAFRQQLCEDIKQFATSPVKPEFWNRLIEHIHYVRGDFQDPNSYAELSKTFKGGTRLTAGEYDFTRSVVASANRAGGQFGFEQPLNKKVTFAADWFTGKHSSGYFTPGVVFKVGPKVTGYAGYSIGNQNASHGNHLFLLEVGYNFN